MVIGTGVAGLACALELAGKRVDLLTKTTLVVGLEPLGAGRGGGGDGRRRLAGAPCRRHGGGRSRTGRSGDRRAPDAEGVTAVRRLIELGAEFDRSARGELDFGREAAHSRRRILHAHGDSTGAELVRALAERVRTAAWVRLFEGAFAAELVVAPDGQDGEPLSSAFWPATPTGASSCTRRTQVVLATGGLGQLFRFTTNPPESTGDGIALAAAAGARLVDLEFVQFHPTALAVDLDPLPLLTRRRCAARARPWSTTPASASCPPSTPMRSSRRATSWRVASGSSWLPAARSFSTPGRRSVSTSRRSFPTIFANCQRAGIDPRVELMPVVPAAHYYMGGVAVDEWGRASLPGLWACGEVSATGVHGANRLASNSLLEALVFGSRVAEAIGASTRREPLPGAARRGRRGHGGRRRRRRPAGRLASAVDPLAAFADLRREIRALSWERLGLVRDAAGLATAQRRFAEILRQLPAAPSEVRNLAIAGSLVAAAALHREESRGAHFRSDFPLTAEAWRSASFSMSKSADTTSRSASPSLPRPLPTTRTPRDGDRMIRPTPPYPLVYEPLLRLALAEDLGRAGDITTEATIPPEARRQRAVGGAQRRFDRRPADGGAGLRAARSGGQVRVATSPTAT